MRKIFLSLAFLSVFSTVVAQEEGQSDLANKIQNPVADLISVPFQNNTDFGDNNTNTLNIQPVLPFGINDNWNLITRTIIPVMNIPDGNNGRDNGVGNITVSTLLTPKKSDSFIWAVGPSFMFPTISENMGYEKLGLAPSVALIKQTKGLTIGTIVQNYFGVAGPSDAADLNFFYSQIFVVKNLSKGWYVNTAPIITANWEADSHSRWTIPLGAGAGKLFALGKLPINAQAGLYKYLEHPTNADWQLRFQLVLLFPKG